MAKETSLSDIDSFSCGEFHPPNPPLHSV